MTARKPYFVRTKEFIDSSTEIHYAIHSSYKTSKFPHFHNFYELLLVLKGRQRITVNGQTLTLKESSLMMIRPHDIHEKAYLENGLHINLAFSQKTANDLLNYLGNGFPRTLLMDSDIPPYVILSDMEKSLIRNRIENLTQKERYGSESIKTQLRILLFELFVKYFTFLKSQSSDLPDWLQTAILQMKEKKNFVRGMPALLELSEKSHEYLCRSFKKYLQRTPTDFINECRLNYATNMLIHSDSEILDICYEAGFDNLSHFYHTFKKSFGTTPVKYRQSMAANQLA